MTVQDFSKGQRVRYIGQAHGKHGEVGTVVRPVKSRKVVTVVWDNPNEPWFDARPDNLELAQ